MSTDDDFLGRYYARPYTIDPHWHVQFGKGTETLVYAESQEAIGEWLRRYARTDPMFFDGVDPAKFTATHCDKADCKPRPKAIGTFEEFLKHPSHGWWRKVGLDDLV
jgi:hypothetical protein